MPDHPLPPFTREKLEYALHKRDQHGAESPLA